MKVKKVIQQKLAKFFQTLEILNNSFKTHTVHKSIRIQVHNALALPILPHGSEN
jgi:hypothetical protein